ncbi:MAG: hypothetical protein L6Q80_10275 [Dehalococcoidia bacterium]|nr:hypothetical protein [Dehalococcoidia bacterium]
MTLARTSPAGDNVRHSPSEATVSVAAARDRFRARMEDAFRLTVSLGIAVQLGTRWMVDNVAKFPDATVHQGVGPPTATKVMTRPFPMAEAVQVLQAKPQLTTELVHGLVVQWWYEFLEEAYESLVRAHLTGTRPAPQLGRLELRLDTAPGVALVDAVVEGAVRNFHFVPNPEKLRRLAKILGLVPNKDNEAFQLVHITVRNVIEHAKGRLGADDLRRLGVKSIRLLDGEHDFREFTAGDQLVLTTWEALRVVRHLGELADEMAAAATSSPKSTGRAAGQAPP